MEDFGPDPKQAEASTGTQFLESGRVMMMAFEVPLAGEIYMTNHPASSGMLKKHTLLVTLQLKTLAG